MNMMTKSEFLAVSGLKSRTLEVWLQQEWIIPQKSSEGTIAFSDADTARARLIVELKRILERTMPVSMSFFIYWIKYMECGDHSKF